MQEQNLHHNDSITTLRLNERTLLLAQSMQLAKLFNNQPAFQKLSKINTKTQSQGNLNLHNTESSHPIIIWRVSIPTFLLLQVPGTFWQFMR